MSWERWDAGSIPSPAQWVKDLALLYLQLRVQLQFGSHPWPQGTPHAIERPKVGGGVLLAKCVRQDVLRSTQRRDRTHLWEQSPTDRQTRTESKGHAHGAEALRDQRPLSSPGSKRGAAWSHLIPQAKLPAVHPMLNFRIT